MGFHDEMRQEGHHRRRDYEDFADRYDRGHPHEGYDDDEVGRRYHDVAANVDEDTYRESARGAFERMDPDQRRQFGQLLHEHAQGFGHDSGYDGSSDHPQGLAEMTTRVHQQNPGLLGQLLGAAGGGGGGLSGLVGGGGGGGGALGGLLGGGHGGGERGGGGNPVARAVLAGIVAYAAKNLMGRRQA
ncbi:MAG: hypothetical protein ACR2J0_05100 [Mycobacteriales bacterium]